MTSVYVAAASKEIARAEGVMGQLRAAGCNVVSTWPEAIRRANTAGFAHDRDLPTMLMRQHAEEDLAQVASADVLLLLSSEVRSTGAGVELGYAIAKGHATGKPMVIGAGPMDSIFYAMADAWFVTDADAVAFLGGLRG